MKKTINAVTDYLFPKSDFITGVGSAINIPGNYYEFNTSPTPEEADNTAIQNDWLMVGGDICSAKETFEEENNIEDVVLCD